MSEFNKEPESQDIDLSEESENLDITGQMSYYHQVKAKSEVSHELALATRHRIMSNLLKYLSYVPVGHSDGNYGYDGELVAQIIEERGCRCEICSHDLYGKKYNIHHTNYYVGDEREFLRIVCIPCHKIINSLHGLLTMLEEEVWPNSPPKKEECLAALRFGPIKRR